MFTAVFANISNVDTCFISITNQGRDREFPLADTSDIANIQIKLRCQYGYKYDYKKI